MCDNCERLRKLSAQKTEIIRALEKENTLLKKAWSNVSRAIGDLEPKFRRCANRNCDKEFIPERRQKHCSPECARKENWARYSEQHPDRQRDYEAEYARRKSRTENSK